MRNRDEIGQLTASFNEMTEGLKQKEKYRAVLDMVADNGVQASLFIVGRRVAESEARQPRPSPRFSDSPAAIE